MVNWCAVRTTESILWEIFLPYYVPKGKKDGGDDNKTLAQKRKIKINQVVVEINSQHAQESHQATHYPCRTHLVIVASEMCQKQNNSREYFWFASPITQ